jgi:hypothetical protein
MRLGSAARLCGDGEGIGGGGGERRRIDPGDDGDTRDPRRRRGRRRTDPADGGEVKK